MAHLPRIPASLRIKPLLRVVIYGTLVFLAIVVLLPLFRDRELRVPFPWDETAPISSEEWENRAERVRDAFAHAYHSYERYAMPRDELRSIEKKGMDSYNGWGVTAFDSLDTMLLMGFEEEYSRALDVVKAANFSFTRQNRGFVPFFETTIRYMGGLLSAYALTNDSLLLQRAQDLADALDPVFNTPSGLPAFSVNPVTGKRDPNAILSLAEFASFQLEYMYLSKASGNQQYAQHVEALNRVLQHANLTQMGGMLPTKWNVTTGQPILYHRNTVSVGGKADSTHEYLLKQYLLTSKTDKANLALYLKTTNYILSNLLYLSPKRGLLYVTDTQVPIPDADPAGVPSHTMEHLSCFLPGLLALGAYSLPWDDISNSNLSGSTDGPTGSGPSDSLKGYDLKQLHLWAAEGLGQTCWLMYADQKSGLGPEEVFMLSPAENKTRQWDARVGKWTQTYSWIGAMDRWKNAGSRGPIPGVSNKAPVVWTEEDRRMGKPNGRDYHVRQAGYFLRPEAVESFYLLWKTTKDVKWRERGWSVFEAIQRETRVDGGYVTLKDVRTSPTTKGHSMPSFFLAETLKYLYLLFREDDPYPLDQWVFTTEAHALPAF